NPRPLYGRASALSRVGRALRRAWVSVTIRPMKRSTERFLTTHTGSLPRPADLIRMMFAREEGVPVDPAALAARVGSAVDEIVRRQVECGLDVVNDGEMSKPSYATYVKERLLGFGGESHQIAYYDHTVVPALTVTV